MNPARGEASTTTIPATSAGWPMRPSGMAASEAARRSGLTCARDAGVSTNDGATPFTRTPRGASSRARVFVRWRK